MTRRSRSQRSRQLRKNRRGREQLWRWTSEALAIKPYQRELLKLVMLMPPRDIRRLRIRA